jgi:hypothetical protein
MDRVIEAVPVAVFSEVLAEGEFISALDATRSGEPIILGCLVRWMSDSYRFEDLRIVDSVGTGFDPRAHPAEGLTMFARAVGCSCDGPKGYTVSMWPT